MTPTRAAGPAGRSRPSLSLELFPPRPGRHASQTWGALDRLLGTGPDFVSVTYRPRFITAGPGPDPAGAAGQDGRTGAPTRVEVVREPNPSEDVISHVITSSRVPLMAHLTCIGYSKAHVVEIVRRFLDMGVRRFLALRGDPPRGVDADDVVSELPRAMDLVRVIREVEADYFGNGRRNVQIAVATYPAVADHGREAEILADKEAAGADLAITQVFYDPDDYLSLTRTAAYSGVTIPILPGVIPMTDLRRLTRLEDLTGVHVPAELARALRSRHGAGVVSAGIEATLTLATALIEGGAPGLHLYTFNRTRPALDVVSQLRLGRILDGAPPDPRTQHEVASSYLNAVPGGNPRLEGRMPGAAQP